MRQNVRDTRSENERQERKRYSKHQLLHSHQVPPSLEKNTCSLGWSIIVHLCNAVGGVGTEVHAVGLEAGVEGHESGHINPSAGAAITLLDIVPRSACGGSILELGVGRVGITTGSRGRGRRRAGSRWRSRVVGRWGGGRAVIGASWSTVGGTSAHAANCVLIAVVGVGVRPADEAVGNVGGIAVGGNAAVEVTVASNGARVVNARSLVVLGDIVARLLDSLLDTPLETNLTVQASAVRDHALDLVVRAGHNTLAVRVAGVGTLEGLHQSWVVETVVGRRGTNAALGLLHDDGEDELGLDAALSRDFLDGLLDIVGLLLAVVVHAKLGARLKSGGNVGVPGILEGLPLRFLRPALSRGAITAEDLVGGALHQGASVPGVGVHERGAKGKGEKLAGSDDVGSGEHVEGCCWGLFENGAKVASGCVW